LKALAKTLGTWRRQRQHQDVIIKVNGREVSLSGDSSEEQIKKLVEELAVPQEDSTTQRLQTSPPEPAVPKPMEPKAHALSRRLILGGDSGVAEVSPDLGGVALGSSSEFYAASRRRISLAFRLSVGLALALAVILFGGIAATIVSGLMGYPAWSAAFGGVSVASLLGTYAYKPLTAISEAAVASQRLEIIHARLANQLKSCTEQSDLQKRIRCQTQVWNTIQKEIAAMSTSSH